MLVIFVVEVGEKQTSRLLQIFKKNQKEQTVMAANITDASGGNRVQSSNRLG